MFEVSKWRLTQVFKWGQVDLAGLSMVAILKMQMHISHPLKCNSPEIWNRSLLPSNLLVGTMAAMLDFLKILCPSCLKSFELEVETWAKNPQIYCMNILEWWQLSWILSKCYISAVRRATGWELGITANYPKIYYWDLFPHNGGGLWFLVVVILVK